MGKKVTEYFSHDANAFSDEKMVELRMEHGMAGYGTFWAIVEKLRATEGYMLKAKYKVLAFGLGVEEEMVRSVIEDFGLFVVETLPDDSKVFFSQSLTDRMAIKDEKTSSAKAKAGKRWGNDLAMPQQSQTDATEQVSNATANDEQSPVYADAMPMQCNSNANAMQQQCCSNAKKSKEKESKEKESKKKGEGAFTAPEAPARPRFQSPSVPEVEKIFLEKGSSANFLPEKCLLEARKFWNYYDSNGWRVGKNPIKNLNSAIAGWILRANEFGNKASPGQNQQSKTEILMDIAKINLQVPNIDF